MGFLRGVQLQCQSVLRIANGDSKEGEQEGSSFFSWDGEILSFVDADYADDEQEGNFFSWDGEILFFKTDADADADAEDAHVAVALVNADDAKEGEQEETFFS